MSCITRSSSSSSAVCSWTCTLPSGSFSLEFVTALQRCPESSSANAKRTLKSSSEGTKASNGALLFQRVFIQRSTHLSRSLDELSAFAPGGSVVLGTSAQRESWGWNAQADVQNHVQAAAAAPTVAFSVSLFSFCPTDVAFACDLMDLHRFKL